MVAELVACAIVVLAAAAEMLHVARCRRIAALSFGPKRQPARWAHAAPWLRVAALAALGWGLTTLLLLTPKVHRTAQIPDKDRKHILLALDVSPSMRLKDAGPNGDQSRMQRAADVLQSYFDRIGLAKYLVSVIAVYTEAKPVVVDTKDVEVVQNVLWDLPMHHAFSSGETDIFSGLTEAAKVAHPWKPHSTTLILISDGDTVPASGMPRMPASVSGVLVIGVGNPRKGSFIDGRLSRQDSSTLRQIAVRLGGVYHDGNSKHVPTTTIMDLAGGDSESKWVKLTRREWALLACTAGAVVFAFLPLLLHYFATTWRPGVKQPAMPQTSRNETSDSRQVESTVQ